VNVLLDSKSLADAGIADDLPITFELANVSLGAALRTLLAEHDLGYTIPDDNVLSITTSQKAKEDVVVRVYNIEDLILSPVPTNEFSEKPATNGADSLVETITTCVQPTSWTESGTQARSRPMVRAWLYRRAAKCNDRSKISLPVSESYGLGRTMGALPTRGSLIRVRQTKRFLKHLRAEKTSIFTRRRWSS